METNEKTVKKGLPNITGRWKLTYERKSKTNEFYGYGLTSYPNPRTGRKIPLIDLASQRVIGQYLIDKESKILYPNRPQDLRTIEWLIHHPEVWVEGYDQFPEEYRRLKNQGSRIKLIALDFQEMKEIENEEFIDALVSRITLNGGQKALGLEKLKVLLHASGLRYRDARYMTDKDKEKKFLRKILKNYVRSSIEAAEVVAKNIDQIDGHRGEYLIAEMIRLKVFTHGGGQFRYRNAPVAASTAKIMHVWESEPETKLEHMSALEKASLAEVARVEQKNR